MTIVGCVVVALASVAAGFLVKRRRARTVQKVDPGRVIVATNLIGSIRR